MSHQPPPDKFHPLSPDERHRLGQIYSLILSWQNAASFESCQQASKANAEEKIDRNETEPVQQE